MKSLSLYKEGNSIVHNIDSITKILYIIATIALAIIVPNKIMPGILILISFICILNAKVFRKVLPNLSKKGMTVIMVEHKMEKIAEYSDRVMLLNEGELIDFDTPEKVFSRDDLRSYGIKEPSYTEICKKLSLVNKKTGLYPTTLEETYELVVNSNE